MTRPESRQTLEQQRAVIAADPALRTYYAKLCYYLNEMHAATKSFNSQKSGITGNDVAKGAEALGNVAGFIPVFGAPAKLILSVIGFIAGIIGENTAQDLADKIRGINPSERESPWVNFVKELATKLTLEKASEIRRTAVGKPDSITDHYRQEFLHGRDRSLGEAPQTQDDLGALALRDVGEMAMRILSGRFSSLSLGNPRDKETLMKSLSEAVLRPLPFVQSASATQLGQAERPSTSVSNAEGKRLAEERQYSAAAA